MTASFKLLLLGWYQIAWHFHRKARNGAGIQKNPAFFSIPFTFWGDRNNGSCHPFGSPSLNSGWRRAAIFTWQQTSPNWGEIREGFGGLWIFNEWLCLSTFAATFTIVNTSHWKQSEKDHLSKPASNFTCWIQYYGPFFPFEPVNIRPSFFVRAPTGEPLQQQQQCGGYNLLCCKTALKHVALNSDLLNEWCIMHKTKYGNMFHFVVHWKCSFLEIHMKGIK